jgi:EAL domain-containing protein (putative c-di-GMP-specific phosphodiesterase class I)
MDGLGQLRGAIRDLSDPMVVMRRVVDQALALIPSAEGAVVELAQDGHLTYVCGAGTLAEYVGTRLEVGASLSGLSVTTGRILRCDDALIDSRVDGEACRAVGVVSMVCVPLRRASGPVGALKVSAARPGAFTEEDVARLSRLAEFISVAIGAVRDLSRIIDEVSAGEQVPTGGSAPATNGNGGGVAGAPHRLAASEFMANVLRPGLAARLSVRKRIERVLDERSLAMYGQPIVDLHSGELIGAEALARFPGPPQQGPDVWFEEAEAVGLGVQLQLAAIGVALGLVGQLPQDSFLAINSGPDAIVAPELEDLLATAPLERIVLELTEHLKIDEYPQLRSRLMDIRQRGLRLAFDDTGAGFASLGNIVNLAPDLIKLDRQLTRGIDIDPVRRALAHALVSFAEDTGARVVAEGIETAGELETARDLGIPYGQGYFIARPSPLAAMPRHFPQLSRRLSARAR